jgi:hypothetical protein
VTDKPILATSSVAILETLVEEAARSTGDGVRRFVEPASGTLSRATSRQHHLLFGRRGSGKSSLLRKAASDLTIDRRPIVFVDLETFKGHAYPDVLLSVLIETFGKFAEWLDTAAIAPSNKSSFWSRLFGSKPTRKPFDKTLAGQLSKDLRQAVQNLRDLLFAEDESEITISESAKAATGSSSTTGANIGDKVFKVTGNQSNSKNNENVVETSEKFVRNKINYLHRHILDYQDLFRRMATLSDGDAFLILDDLYHLKKRDQPSVIDYFHRIAKGNRLWLKIGTIRHRSQWYINGDPPVGAKLGDDIQEIDLDLTLERYASTREFLGKILDTFLGEAGLKRDDILTDGALDRLVLACGGVTRDFLGILRRAILIARERGDTFRGEKVGAEDVNNASGEYDSSKREELSRDTLDESDVLQQEFDAIISFARDYANANVFLVDRAIPEDKIDSIEELVDLRLIHRIKGAVTVSDRPGKKFEAFMLDLSQYSASRKKRDFELIEFWRPDATDKIRRPGLIYKELDGDEIITKTHPSKS